MLSGCRVHSCAERGFIWVDSVTGVTIGGIVHFSCGPKLDGQGYALLLWSSQVSPNHLPVAFVSDFQGWDNKVPHYNPASGVRYSEYTNVRFAGSDGRIIEVSSNLLATRARSE